jgi:K+-transporting ATPase ATPase C chain
MVMASGSGLDPHITLDNALYQLDRIAGAWAKDTNRDPAQMHQEIQRMLEQRASAPGLGLFGPKIVNVLEMNLQLREHYGAPPA